MNQRYVFVGNREYVLREMMRQDLDIRKVWVMENSFLHNRLLKDPFIDFVVIGKKKDLLREIRETDFDVLVSNGCKYILPISQLMEEKGKKDIRFINVHPSFLPDLKGMDPINGACLLGRSGGATCHNMDDGIDSGSIISRIEIPMTEDIDAGLLFQLSFKAEVEVFRAALRSGFTCRQPEKVIDNPIYYSISDDDLIMDCDKGVDYLLRQARAFGYRSKGVCVRIDGQDFRYFGAEEITNQYIREMFKDIPEKKIGIAFEKSVVFKLDGRIVRLNQLTVDNAGCLEGKYLEK